MINMITTTSSLCQEMLAQSEDDLSTCASEKLIAGYLDTALLIFKEHHHPFIIVGTTGLRWSSSNPCQSFEVDVLVDSNKLHRIASDLDSSNEWKITTSPYESDGWSHETDKAMSKEFPGVWLRYQSSEWAGGIFSHLHLYPEEAYQLSVDECAVIEIPDLRPREMITLENEYYRDSNGRFGPRTIAHVDHRAILRPHSRQARLLQKNVQLLIPTIEAHLNALLDQIRIEDQHGRPHFLDAMWQIDNLIRYQYWDWPEARDWLLKNKVHPRNRAMMEYMIDKFKRKTVTKTHSETQMPYSVTYPWIKSSTGDKI